MLVYIHSHRLLVIVHKDLFQRGLFDRHIGYLLFADDSRYQVDIALEEEAYGAIIALQIVHAVYVKSLFIKIICYNLDSFVIVMLLLLLL